MYISKVLDAFYCASLNYSLDVSAYISFVCGSMDKRLRFKLINFDHNVRLVTLYCLGFESFFTVTI